MEDLTSNLFIIVKGRGIVSSVRDFLTPYAEPVAIKKLAIVSLTGSFLVSVIRVADCAVSHLKWSGILSIQL
jgi:hypothetical protein